MSNGLDALAPYINWGRHRNLVDECMRIRVGRVRGRGLGKGHGETWKSREDLEERHLVGAASEVAFRLWMGVDPRPDNETWGRGDVEGVEVRGTFARGGHLIVQDSEPNNRLAVLVILSRSGGAIIRGWMPISEAKGYPPRTADGHERLDNHWVPNDALYPMSSFPVTRTTSSAQRPAK